METPYRSLTGTVGLTNMTDGPALENVDLLGKGGYRLQVCRRWADDGGAWLLRWWPTRVEEPPRWLRRDPSPYEDEDSLAEDIVAVVAWSPGHRLSCTADDLADRLLVPAATARVGIERAVANRWLGADFNNGVVTLIVPGGADLPELDPPPLGPSGTRAEVPHSREPAARANDTSEIAGFIQRYQEQQRQECLRRRPPAGPPPRTGYINQEIVVWRDDRLVTVAHSPLSDPRTAAEVAGGIVVAGHHIIKNKRHERAAYVKWDGSLVELGALRADFKVSRDGTILAAQELGAGRRGMGILHLIDLAHDTRHTVTVPAEFDLRITCVTRDTIWYRPRRSVAEEMCWTINSAGPVPSPGPPPVGSWQGPSAPEHRHYTAHHCGRSFQAGQSITILDNGQRRTYRVPEPGCVDDAVAPAWEDPDHLLLVPGVTTSGGLEFLGCIFRLDVNTGAMETAATDTRVKTFIWPWPQVVS